MRIAVCGEGPVALSVAAVCGWRGHSVRVLATQPDRWRDRIEGWLPDGTPFTGPIDLVTSTIRMAVARADAVIVCAPSYQRPTILKDLAPHVEAETLVGAIPGFGGFGLLARETMPHVRSLFGTQRIPFVVGRHTAGRSVAITGIRRQTFVATVPARRAFAVSRTLGRVLGVPTVPMSHFINVELSPSNSIVNPARLYSLARTLSGKMPERREEFFLDWDGRASKVLLQLDRELQEGRRLIPRDTSFVAPILLQYDANDAATLTYRFRRLTTLAGRPVPWKRVGRVYAFDYRSGYIREDIDWGIVLIRDILRMAGALTPMMNEIVEWRATHLPKGRSWRRAAQENPVGHFRSIEALVSSLD